MLETIQKARQSGLTIGFTCSTAELTHPGFIEMLAQAKSQCDFLVFGLLTDPTISRPDSKNKPVETTFERWMRLQAIRYIDVIVPFDTEHDIENMIAVIKPDVRFVGEEYKGTKHTGWDLCPIVYNERKHDWSSTNLRKKIYESERKKMKAETTKISFDEIDRDSVLDELNDLIRSFASKGDIKKCYKKLMKIQDKLSENIPDVEQETSESMQDEMSSEQTSYYAADCVSLDINGKIPTTLEECYDALAKIPDVDDWLKRDESEALTAAHHSIGMAIRNNWGFWTSSVIKRLLMNMGLQHPDDMSSFVLTSFHRVKNGKDPKMDEQIEYFKKFWALNECDRYEYVTNKKCKIK